MSFGVVHLVVCFSALAGLTAGEVGESEPSFAWSSYDEGIFCTVVGPALSIRYQECMRRVTGSYVGNLCLRDAGGRVMASSCISKDKLRERQWAYLSVVNPLENLPIPSEPTKTNDQRLYFGAPPPRFRICSTPTSSTTTSTSTTTEASLSSL